jgi:hypothetical protein
MPGSGRVVRRKSRSSAEESAHLRIVASLSVQSRLQSRSHFKRPAPRRPERPVHAVRIWPRGQTNGSNWRTSTWRSTTGRRGELDVERAHEGAWAVGCVDLGHWRAAISCVPLLMDTWSGMIGWISVAKGIQRELTSDRSSWPCWILKMCRLWNANHRSGKKIPHSYFAQIPVGVGWQLTFPNQTEIRIWNLHWNKGLGILEC